MTRYVTAFTWTDTIQRFLDTIILERPLLNVCSGQTDWGDVTADLYQPADTRASWSNLPFADNSFAAVFADPPWNAGYKKDVSAFVHEALRIAPVAYLMAPWIYGSRIAKLTACWVRQLPGINNAIVLTRYERTT